MESSTVISVHVPKTGGSTLHEVFRRTYGSRFLQLSPTDLAPPGKLKAARLIHGHPAYRARYLVSDPKLITVLRHPVDRALSAYYDGKRKAKDNPAKHMSALEWLDTQERNEQTRVTGGNLDEYEVVGVTEHLLTYVQAVAYWAGWPTVPSALPELRVSHPKGRVGAHYRAGPRLYTAIIEQNEADLALYHRALRRALKS